MPRLNLRGRRADAGGAATIVAVLLSGGVLLGMTALVVDVGRLYNEREELQSGADSAGVAIVKDCVAEVLAAGPADKLVCADALEIAQRYADKNARDGVSAIAGEDGVCFSDDRFGPLCTGIRSGNLTDCLPLPAGAEKANYVEVRTSTQVDDGSYLLPMMFAQTLVSGVSGVNVGACARVGWGSPGGGLALTFSTCEFEKNTADGTSFPPENPDFSHQIVLKVHDTEKGDGGDAGNCHSSNSGADLPGGFGWTDGDQCVTTIEPDGTYSPKTGAPGNPNAGCKDAIEDAFNSGTPVLVPIFDEVTGQGTNKGEYHLRGFAAFVITGYYKLPSSIGSEVSKLTGLHHCSGSDKCIYGYFTQTLLPYDGSFGGSENLGATVVKTIG